MDGINMKTMLFLTLRNSSWALTGEIARGCVCERENISVSLWLMSRFFGHFRLYLAGRNTQSKSLPGIILSSIGAFSQGKLWGCEPVTMPQSNPLLGFMLCRFDLIWQEDECDFGSGCERSNAHHPDHDTKYGELGGGCAFKLSLSSWIENLLFGL